MIPQGTLRIETQATNPPKPVLIHATVSGRSVAVLTIEDVVRSVEQYRALQEYYEAARKV